jgi:hypothetical protein
MDQGVFRDSASGALPQRGVEAAPGQIRRLVYLTAYVPVPSLPDGAVLASLPEGRCSISGAILIGDPGVRGAQRIIPRDPEPAHIEKGRQARCNDVSTEEYLSFAVHCKPDLLVAGRFDDAHGTPQRWGDNPTALHPLHPRPLRPSRAPRSRNQAGRRGGAGQQIRGSHAGSSHPSFASMPGKLAMGP